MRLEGIWENVETAALFKIMSIPNCSDEYEWHYGFDGKKYSTSESVLIKFMETNKSAHVRSKRFDSPLLHIDNPNQFRIGSETFKRLEMNPYGEIK